MPFAEYHSIPNLDNKLLLETQQNTPVEEKWRCEEKIHGCNFSIYIYDNKTIKFAKRHDFINPEYAQTIIPIFII